MPSLFDRHPKGGDQVLWNESYAIHDHDYQESDLKHLVLIVEDIMERTTIFSPEAEFRTFELDPKDGFANVMEIYVSTITKLSRELTSKPGEDEDEKTSRIIKALSNYSWKTKVVLAFSAFSIKYGKIRLVFKLFNENSLARAVALLKQQADVPESPPYLGGWFKGLSKLIHVMLKLTKRIIDFTEPTQSVRPENQEKAMADFGIPRAVRWTIYSVVVCSSQIMAVLVMRRRSLAPYEWHLHELVETLNSSLEELSEQPQTPLQPRPAEEPARRVARAQTVQQAESAEPAEQQGSPGKTRFNVLQKLCWRGIPSVHSDRSAMAYQRLHSKPENHLLSSNFHDETMRAEAYEPLMTLSDTSRPSNNVDIIKALVDEEDQPLLHGSTKERVSMDALKSKMVLLFISDLGLCHDETTRFSEVFLESRTHPKRLKNQCEIVWLPIVDSSMSWKEKKHHFETIQSWIPWYSIYYPSLISPAAIKYIKEVWKFNGKHLVVVLDSSGKVANLNAIHMIRIWGSRAFPFTQIREEMLWKTEPRGIAFLVDSIDPMLTDLIAEYKYICLFGGEDNEWIQRLTSAAEEVANAANIPLEFLNMGRSCSTDIRTTVSENLSHLVQDINLIKFFWLRLESIIESRFLVESAENDPLTREIKMLLNFDKDGKSWALISRKESRIMCLGNGENVLKSFMEYNKWKDNAADRGFLPALHDYLHELQNTHNCKLLESTEDSPPTHHRSNPIFLWRSLSCFADPSTK